MKVLLILFLSFPGLSWAGLSKYPIVSEVKGKSFWVTSGGREIPIKNKMVLTIQGEIKTSADSFVRIEFSPDQSLKVFSRSHSKIPVIEWESGKIERLELLQGRVQLRCGHDCGFQLQTPVFSEPLAAGELILDYDSATGRLEMTVLEGHQVFRGLESEQSHLLQAGQKGVFQGIIENGVPQFDELLRGKKVAKGELVPMEVLAAQEFQVLKSQTLRAKPRPTLLPKKLRKQADQICEKPYAKLNECVWRIEKSSVCVRERCNANGQWTDRTEMIGNQAKCSKKEHINTCDY
ncbi:MAG: hypothetical protein LW875_09190 [Proteobacteria bacterium]|jgi:hypothetical protein|nr:hypothetical protein [Pseudomonadota bacterium]